MNALIPFANCVNCHRSNDLLTARAYGAKFPKAVVKITDALDQLIAFYDFPAEHLRTTNPIESTFSTVRDRSKITKGPDHAPRESPWPTS